jgi:uncharacterized protein YecE (DUF72 family)
MADLHTVRVGCAGWSIPKKAGHQFPLGSDQLNRYSQRLNCCEINSSFYRPHKVATWQRWAASVPGDFRFSVKVPRMITHEARLVCSPELLLEFLNQIRHLHDKLGPILVQLPPSLEFDRERVSAFFSLLRQHYVRDIVCEPRHNSWFTDLANKTLQDFEIARVATDPACVPTASAPGGASTIAYFRLHGSPRTYYSAYTELFLAAISAQLRELATMARVWCVFDNTASGAAVTNAIQLRAKIYGQPFQAGGASLPTSRRASPTRVLRKV